MQDKIHEVLQRSPLNHQNTWSPLSMPALRPWSLRCFGSFSTRKSPTLEHLRHPAARGEVFLVGTSHISAASAAEAKHCKHKTQPYPFLGEEYQGISGCLYWALKKQQGKTTTYTNTCIYIVRKRQNNIIYWYIVYRCISICTCDMYLHIYIYIYLVSCQGQISTSRDFDDGFLFYKGSFMSMLDYQYFHKPVAGE